MFSQYIPSKFPKNENSSHIRILHSHSPTSSHCPSIDNINFQSLTSQRISSIEFSSNCEHLSGSSRTTPSDTDYITEDFVVSHSSPISTFDSLSNTFQNQLAPLQVTEDTSLSHEVCSPSLSSGYESVSEHGPSSLQFTSMHSFHKNNYLSSQSSTAFPQTNHIYHANHEFFEANGIWGTEKTGSGIPVQSCAESIFLTTCQQRSQSPPPPPPAYHSSHSALLKNKLSPQFNETQSVKIFTKTTSPRVSEVQQGESMAHKKFLVCKRSPQLESVKISHSLYNVSEGCKGTTNRPTKFITQNVAVLRPYSQFPCSKDPHHSSQLENSEKLQTCHLYDIDIEKQVQRNCEITQHISQTLQNTKLSDEMVQSLKDNATMVENRRISQISSTALQISVCSTCHQRIFNACDACQAMGKVYHNNCFICCCCKRSLRGKIFYKDQGKVYCEDDYLYCGFQRRAEKCSSCGHIITDMILQAIGKSYHPGCFRCRVCNECLDGLPFTIDSENRIYCVQDYHRVYAPRCESCGLAIIPVEGSDEIIRVVAMDRNFHVECFHCEDCQLQLTDEQESRCYPLTELNGKIHLLCKACHLARRETPSSTPSTNLTEDYSSGGKSSPISRAQSLSQSSPQQPPSYSATYSGTINHRVINDSTSPNPTAISTSLNSSIPSHRNNVPLTRPLSNSGIENTFTSVASGVSNRTSSTVILPKSSSNIPSVGIKYSPLLRKSIPSSTSTNVSEVTIPSNTTSTAAVHITTSSSRFPRS